MMATAGGLKRVRFAVQQQGAFAVQLRLTPALREALLLAQEEGQEASIRFGEGPHCNAIRVSGAAFRFNALAEESCDLLHLAPGAAAIVGAVRRKLMVQRNIADERERVRARAEEAVRQGHERKAQLLDSKPSKAPKPRTVVQRVTPPPQGPAAPAGQHQRGLTLPPTRQQHQQLTASMLAAPAGRPPTHPVRAAAAARGTTPPPLGGGITAKPMHKSASTGKLGNRHSSTGSLGSMQVAASPLVLQAARSGANLRLCLIATLAERPMPMAAVKTVLSDAAARVRTFKVPSKQQLERALKAVAEFKAPGLYAVYSMLLKELEELAPAGTASPQGGVPCELLMSNSAQSGEAALARGRKKRTASAAPAAAGDVGTAACRPPVAACTGGKRSRQLDWTDDDSSGADQPPATRQATEQQHQQHQQPALFNADPSPPSVGPAGGSSDSGGAMVGAAGVPPRRTSSSRGSDHADESWIEEHADRQPQPAAPIRTKEEYHERATAFNSKYEVYFALHQLIEAHKKDFEALDAAIRGAVSEGERERHRRELDQLFQRRGQRAKRWDAAYRVLHQELAAAKARMSEFVLQLQRQQHLKGGGPGSAAAVVRVT